MILNEFFITSKVFKELIILNYISNNESCTQRDMSSVCKVSVAMINSYIDEYSKNGLIKLDYQSKKTVSYKLTSKGEQRRRLLNIKYLESSLDVFNNAIIECKNIIQNICIKGYKNILFYGAGEVCELMLRVLNDSDDTGLSVLAIIDDNTNKQGKLLHNYPIVSINEINKYNYDGIMITSYTNNDIIKNKLLNAGFDCDKIIEFF